MIKHLTVISNLNMIKSMLSMLFDCIWERIIFGKFVCELVKIIFTSYFSVSVAREKKYLYRLRERK